MRPPQHRIIVDGLALLLLLLLWQMRNVAHAGPDAPKTALRADDAGDATPTLELPQPLLAPHAAAAADGSRQQRAAFDADTDGGGDVDGIESDAAHTRQGRRKPLVKRTARPTLMDIALEASAREGLHAMAELYGRLELDIMEHGRVLEANHPATLLSKFSAPAEGSEQREMAAYATITATKAFRRNYKNYNELARQSHAQKISLRRTALEALCPPREPPLCMPAAARYRTHDGTCNNKRHPRWGAAQMPFNRFLPPEYGDGVDSVRDATEGGPLSSSRFVSLLVHGAKDGEAPLTLMTAQWGQLLDHDLTSTAQPRAINGSVPSCCGRKDFHPSCFPIKVPLDDPWLAPLKVRCLEFLRSAPAQRRDCVLSWREQTNQATSYIDASPIYSNSAKSSDNARVFRKGLLVFGRGNPAEDVCQRGAIATQCIRAGDGRSGEQPGLLALHHVWVGEHNRIALQLSEMNPHWSDEKLYQETRRIVGAMFQHITYREFLPIILGREVCKLFDLELVPSGYYIGYNSKVNPTVANSFAAAAFRFGHSLVQNSYMRCDRHHNILSNNVSLHEEFQRGDIGSAGSLHRLIRGLATQRALKRDEFITPELTNHLFQTPGFPFGLDLAAINIQRGRDHGIAPYTAWRVPCGLTAINDWDDFANVVGPESAQRIAHAYRSVHDIDLFVGGISERPVVGGLVGPTFACIIAQQFSNSRKGDRFWYENGGFESSFTPAQLHSIRRISLAQVLCRTVGGGTFQPNIFIPANFEGNERLTCGIGLLAPIDLNPWLEQDPFNADAEVEPETFEQQQPEQVFKILNTHHGGIEKKADFTNRLNASIPSSTPHTSHMKLPPTPVPHVPHVSFIPNASSGFQRPNAVISTTAPQINDKLDFKRKGHPTLRPSIKNKPLNGVHNKLDKKGTRVTLNIKGVNRHRLPTTTRRTVIVNNLPVELRTVDHKQNVKNSTMTKKKNSTTTLRTTTATITKNKTQNKTANSNTKTISTDEPESRATDHVIEEKSNSSILQLAGNITLHNLNETSTKIGVNNLLDFSNEHEINNTRINKHDTTNKDTMADIDPLKHSSTEDHKRVQREQKLDSNNKTKKPNNPTALIISVNRPRPTSSTKNRTRTNTTNANNTLLLQLVKGNTTVLNTGKTKLNYSSATIRTFYPTETSSNKLFTTKLPKISKTTKHNIELRQYQTRPIYTRPPTPHKVIVDGPNADQYEIEINIRQTNKGPTALRPSTSYTASTNGYHSVNTINYVDYPSTTPAYLSYYQPSATTNSPSSVYLSHSKRTKPPTIIYLNEHDERTTTSRPSIFQNFITFASNSFSPSPNSRPQSYKEPLHYETASVNDIVGGGNGNPHSSIYSPRPPSSQTILPPLASSFSQVTGAPSGGIAHASAISAGNFGSIVGVASANGADSTFSFNIRPRPDVIPASRPEAGTYGLLPPRKPQSSTYEYVNVPHHSTHVLAHQTLEPPNREELNSPFSTANRPTLLQPVHGYYSRTANTEGSEPKKHVSSPSIIKILDITPDVDYSDKTIQSKHAANVTFSTDDDSEENDTTDQNEFSEYSDYYDDEDNYNSPADRYNRDGYLRPQLMLGALFKRADVKERSGLTNVTKLDDNYVLPAMSADDIHFFHSKESLHAVLGMLNVSTEKQITDYPDTLGKHFSNDILAEEDYDEDNDSEATEDTLQVTKNVEPKTNTDKNETAPHEKIAFAPITLLTKPERPDNWVIYELPEDKPLLPQIPDVSTEEEAEHTIEIPMPIRRPSINWLLNEFGKLPSSTINDIPQRKKSDENVIEINTTENVHFEETTISPELDTNTETTTVITTTEPEVVLDDTTENDTTDTTTEQPPSFDTTDISQSTDATN